ncbi:hypothetical protein RFI_07007, partial [Reticulomyxa filosa]
TVRMLKKEKEEEIDKLKSELQAIQEKMQDNLSMLEQQLETSQNSIQVVFFIMCVCVLIVPTNFFKKKKKQCV